MIKFNTRYVSEFEQENLMSLLSDQEKRTINFFDECHDALQKILNIKNLHLTSSCTASLEIAALQIGIGPGDEFILPSYTFSSTANAFILRGASPVFVDIKKTTLNIDEELIESSITENTKAIVVVHYAGIACNMKKILDIGKRWGIPIIEDAAQAHDSFYFGKALGTLGDFGALSFHHTKNIHCGEGGLLVCRSNDNHKTGHYIIEKGTNRLDLINGGISKYEWVCKGSSYVLSEFQAAVLSSQLKCFKRINDKRKKLWYRYFDNFRQRDVCDKFKTPEIESGATANGHIFYIVLDEKYNVERTKNKLLAENIEVVRHYTPLHESAAGKKYQKRPKSLPVTEFVGKQLLRLPIHMNISEKQVDLICDKLICCLS